MRGRIAVAGRLGLFLLALGVTACTDLIVKPPGENLNVEDFEAVWSTVDEYYPCFEFKGIDWDSLYTVYLPRAEAARGDEFYRVLHELLYELKDGHVRYMTPGGSERYPWVPPRRRRDQGLYNPFVVREYFSRDLELSPSGKIEYGILPDNIGYILLADFHEDFLINDFPSVIGRMRNTAGLIIDIRQRVGGSTANIAAVVSCFLTAPLPWLTFISDGEALPLTPLQPRSTQAYTNPVVVLISGLTFSAGELCTEMLKQLPQVTAIGDTTGGGGLGGTIPDTSRLVLPSGKRFEINYLDIRRYDGEPIEWNGVPPDIRVVNTAVDIAAGRDLQLEFAIELLVPGSVNM